MEIYKIYAVNNNGDLDIISPMACNTDKAEMIKIAKRLKYEMTEYYSNVELKVDSFKYISTETVEV